MNIKKTISFIFVIVILTIICVPIASAQPTSHTGSRECSTGSPPNTHENYCRSRGVTVWNTRHTTTAQIVNRWTGQVLKSGATTGSGMTTAHSPWHLSGTNINVNPNITAKSFWKTA